MMRMMSSITLLSQRETHLFEENSASSRPGRRDRFALTAPMRAAAWMLPGLLTILFPSLSADGMRPYLKRLPGIRKIIRPPHQRNLQRPNNQRTQGAVQGVGVRESRDAQTPRRWTMLWTIFVLLVLWLLGVVSTYTLGGFIHLLLLLALIVLILQLVSGRRPVV